jgi:DNA-binding NarL/FixJ family response regulator
MRQTLFDTVVVDLMLPKLDGLSVIEAMRKEGNVTPVVVLSAKRSVEDKVRCLRGGADNYLQCLSISPSCSPVSFGIACIAVIKAVPSGASVWGLASSKRSSNFTEERPRP